MIRKLKKLCKKISRKMFGNRPLYKILVVGLEEHQNLGDVVISACTAALLRDVTRRGRRCDFDIRTVDMTNEACCAMIPYAHLVVFAGGGLIKYKYQKFPEYLSKIIAVADKNGVPVMFNSVGVEDFDAENPRCVKLQNAINRSCVRCITTRDDLPRLQEHYVRSPDVLLRRVADPAVFTPEVYGVCARESDVIGLGVVRAKIFPDNGIPLTEDVLLELWQGIIRILDAQGRKWRLFTNGWPTDYDFALKLLDRLGLEPTSDRLAPRPETDTELVNTIADFCGVIACRLHACILSYSMKIPAVGLVWNEKLRFFGDAIGCPERFIDPEAFDAQTVTSALLRAMEEGYDAKDYDAYRRTEPESLRDFLIPQLKRFRAQNRRRFEWTKLYVYGVGANGKAPEIDKGFYRHVEAFLDHRPNKLEKPFLKKQVLPPEALSEQKGAHCFVLISRDVSYKDAAERLIALGLKENLHFTRAYEYDNYRYRRFRYYKALPWWRFAPFDDAFFFPADDAEQGSQAGFAPAALAPAHSASVSSPKADAKATAGR